MSNVLFLLFIVSLIVGFWYLSKGSETESKNVIACNIIPKNTYINNGDSYLDVTSTYHKYTDYNIGGRWVLELAYDSGFKSSLGYKPDLAVSSGVMDTGSMLPTFGAFDTVLIETNPKNIRVGQIITFDVELPLYGSDSAMHRIVEIGNDENGMYFITKGDNNCNVDNWKIRYENITGRVLGVIW